MQMNNIKRKAKAFLNKYKPDEINPSVLKGIIKSLGYTVIEYNHIYNDENVSNLIKALGIEEVVNMSKGFTYADKQRRLVFLHEDLSDYEKSLVLAHEAGHIYCGHLSSYPIIGKDVVEEHEANEFTHYIMKKKSWGRTKKFVKKHKWIVIVAAVLLLLTLFGTAVLNASDKEEEIQEYYYLTSTGNKFHKEECIFVKDKSNVQKITAQELEDGDYEPCGICLPVID